MKRTIWVRVALAAFVSVAIVLGIGRLRETEAAQAQQTRAREIPKFQVDLSWPKIPNGWVLGPVAGAAADDQNHIWVLHRPIGGHPGQDVRPGQKTGPPVMEFDVTGNYIQGWGGSGQGYNWPETSHGIYVDYKGFVWIIGGGNNDQILKFTKAGKFVMQIGRSGQKDRQNPDRPQGQALYSKTNELFISDNYGGGRVIVFDADTGAFKRTWGAFGKAPLDTAPPRVAIPAESHIPAKELDPKDPGPQHFENAHSIGVSNDGLVYVSDRGGKRVQVFTIDGKFVTQVFIDRWCEAPSCANGSTVISTAFSSDPAQRFLYAVSMSPARIWVLDRKTLELLDSFGRLGVAPGEFYVTHNITTDSQGNLYASENEDGRRIQKFVFKGISPTVSN